MKPSVKVGDLVVLNPEGTRVAFGEFVPHPVIIDPCTVTYVADTSITNDLPSFIVEVDHPKLCDLLLYDACFIKYRK